MLTCGCATIPIWFLLLSWINLILILILEMGENVFSLFILRCVLLKNIFELKKLYS